MGPHAEEEDKFTLIDEDDDASDVGEDVLLGWVTDAASWLSILRLLVTGQPATITAYPEGQEAQKFRVLKLGTYKASATFENPL